MPKFFSDNSGRGGGNSRGRGSFGGGRGGFKPRNFGPSGVMVGINIYHLMIELGDFMHQCEKEMLFKACTSSVPKFNRQVFNSNDASSAQEVGTVNEILGPFNKYVHIC